MPIAACGPEPGVRTIGPVDADFVIHDLRSGERTGMPRLIEDASLAHAVIFGEFHDDRTAHRLQLMLLRGLHDAWNGGVLGLEMFERDVQPALDRYRAGEMTEAEFLLEARPWPNYASDYRPMVEFAREEGWELLATNLPQRVASAIARDGLVALDGLPSSERRYAAATHRCPEDAYWERFAEAMLGEGAAADMTAHAGSRSMLLRTYEAQCARDEAMADAIATAIDSSPILHINGAFHSDFGHGIVDRLLARRPHARVLVITAVPVEDPARADPAPEAGRADYLIFTRTPGER